MSKNKRKKKHIWLKRTGVTIGVVSLLGFTSLEGFLHSNLYNKLCEKTYDSLASIDEGTFRRLENTKILDANGEVIGEIDTGSYQYHEISEIPLELQNAYIAAEDQNFKYHHGVDYKAIVRAGLALIKNKGEITQGGSTITQQVIKNNLLTQEQTFQRKVLEIMIAPSVEKKYSKQDIMEFYCNSNYYGNGCYGVGNAASFYFGKELKELTLAECAMIAGISNSPNNYNPVANMELAQKKMNSILSKMLEQKMITQKEYDTAKKQEIIVTETSKKVIGSNNYMSSFAIHCATLELMEQEGFEFQYLFPDKEAYKNYKEKYKETYTATASLVRSGGYTIHTSFNMDIQKKLQKSMDECLNRDKQVQDNGKYLLQGAGVCIDNETGYIIAMVGGREKDDQYNRGFLSERQPGSTIKPILDYGPAFEAGLAYPSSIYTDREITVKESDFTPKNANGRYLGNMSVREAIARSTNTIALQVFLQVGQENAMQYLEAMKFTSLSYADNIAVPICLGGFTNGVTVKDIAKAYATFANYGKYSDRTCIIKIEHEQNGLLYDGEKEKEKQIYSQDTAFMVTDILQGVVKEDYGTAHGITVPGQAVAGKTGTTNQKRDSWFCGYTPYYTSVVWVGNDDNTPLSYSSYALEIWDVFMNSIHKEKENKDFIVPDTINYYQVNADGTLGDIAYEKEKLNMDLSTYERRPAGYDVYSKTLASQLQEFQKKEVRKKEIQKAKRLLKKFESYKITDEASATGFKEKYAETLTAIEEVSDLDKQKEFKTRLSEKYEKLLETYQIWEQKIQEHEVETEKQAIDKQKLQDDANKVAAYEALHRTRIEHMETYLSMLSGRRYNTDATQRLVSDANACLESCIQYEEYNNIKQRFDAEVERIQTLPTEIPFSKDSETYPPDVDGYPDPTPEVTPEITPNPTLSPETPIAPTP